MIVTAMTPDEILKEIHTDFETVVKMAFYLTKDYRRPSKKSRKKQIEKTYDYVSPRKNNWIIYINYLAGDPLFVIALHYMDASGFNAIIVDSDLKTLTYYSTNFVERYNEKCLNENGFSKVEIFKNYISKNATGSIKYVLNDGLYGARFFTKTKEGISLGFTNYLNGTIFHRCITFLSHDLVFGKKNVAHDSLSQELMKIWEINFEQYKGEFTGGIIDKLSA